MENYLVIDLMVPLSEYATVPTGTTLYDAVLALEKAQTEFDHTKYRHRGVLILDQKQRVIGKLSQLDVLRALEPQGADEEKIEAFEKYGFSAKFIRDLRQQHRLLSIPLKEMLKHARRLKVEDFMQATTAGEYVDEKAPLELGIQQLVSGHHLSLLVTREKSIVGILRLADVFAAVFHAMKELETTS